MGKPTKPMRIFFSPLSERFYATNRYREGGRSIVCTGVRHDVTDDVMSYIRQAVDQAVKKST